MISGAVARNFCCPRPVGFEYSLIARGSMHISSETFASNASDINKITVSAHLKSTVACFNHQGSNLFDSTSTLYLFDSRRFACFLNSGCITLSFSFKNLASNVQDTLNCIISCVGVWKALKRCCGALIPKIETPTLLRILN